MTSTDSARAEAWDEGYEAGRTDAEFPPATLKNPYRAARAETTTAGDEVHPSGVSFRWEDDLAETTTGPGSCPVLGCQGDARYAPPGRGHRDGCTYLSAETTTEQCEPRLSDHGQDTHCRACGVEHRAETTAVTDEDMFEQAWEVVARVRDAHPRRVDDAPTEDIVDALIDAGLLATARTVRVHPTYTIEYQQKIADELGVGREGVLRALCLAAPLLNNEGD